MDPVALTIIVCAVIAFWAVTGLAVWGVIHHLNNGRKHASPLDQPRERGEEERHNAHGDDPEWFPGR